ncbi:MAG: phosphoenolpyruvate carboxylase [Deltaproteobacteria bacterium]|uniref:Phosphoenolpyruvate carboxylase n=1 Tax=Candidatus Zymogenus saltonus TaxID=2844893 RepID=A0A9D8PPR7_9DELT|nr:phosphoenolpyruvate carboxylase [Candidatus Zymogenus saltonus]
MKEMIKIPKCMSTQHPDNVTPPFFSESIELGGEDEVQEAYYAFSHLGCDEQMWDCEGKEVDNYVVKKLLTQYPAFFNNNILGKDLFLTLRVPNPTVERGEAKILLETLESIPRSFDTSRLFYENDIAPIFEVILPMTATHKSLNRIYNYYTDFVIGKQDSPFCEGDITIADWIGEFMPKEINVIPLFEDMKSMLDADTITREYLSNKEIRHQRVFLARSDPAMNYGLISAMLMNRIALKKLYSLSHDIGVEIYPIIGLGSAPFRGNLTPDTVKRIVREYPSVHTFTIQSSFKYDNPPDKVRGAIEELRKKERLKPVEVDEERCLDIISRYTKRYQEQVAELAGVINQVAKYIPERRKRKLHVGLFGYAREVGGIQLPRAIKFTAALYSVGLPPELLGLDALNREDFDFLRKAYFFLDDDLKDSLRFFNKDTPFIPEGLKRAIDDLPISYTPDEKYKGTIDSIINSLGQDSVDKIGERILVTAHVRGFLG